LHLHDESRQESSDSIQETPAAPRECSIPAVTHAHELIDNIPYILMMMLGAAALWIALAGSTWRWPAAGLYVVYGVVGALWIIWFVCPYCSFYGTRRCPCGYGQIAARLRSRRETSQFTRKFRKHIPVIVPLWFIPLILGVIRLARGFSRPLLVLLIAFAVNSFVILPLVSRKYGCSKCPQKDTCPWMGNCKA